MIRSGRPTPTKCSTPPGSSLLTGTGRRTRSGNTIQRPRPNVASEPGRAQVIEPAPHPAEALGAYPGRAHVGRLGSALDGAAGLGVADPPRVADIVLIAGEAVRHELNR